MAPYYGINLLLKCSDMADDCKAITHLPVTHSQTIPAFTPKLQCITGRWLVLIAPTHGGMARLS